MTRPYEEFLTSKVRRAPTVGFNVDVGALSPRLFPFQRDMVKWALRKGRAAIFADTGLGKQQPLTEPVLTPSGWSTMGAIRVGDFVVGSNGKPTEVTGVFPQGTQRVFRIELSDGTFSRCGSEHLWAVRTKVNKYRGDAFVAKTTAEIAQSIHRDWQLPMVSPVEFDRTGRLPIDPYALGVLLGDGSLTPGNISVCTDNDIGAALGWRKTRQHKTCEYVGYWKPPVDIAEALLRAGLIGQRSSSKVVPAQFLTASPADRLALLQGLMDTDGYAMPDGGAEFCSTSPSMFACVRELVQSLGGVARGVRRASATYRCKGELRTGQPAWRVNVKLPAGQAMFRLPRKASAHVSPEKYKPARIVRRVVDEGVDEPQVCISVEAADNLYVTRSYILTHNTSMQLEWAKHVSAHTGGRVLILAPLAVAAQTVREGERCGVPVTLCREGGDERDGVNITNYDRLHKFDTSQFTGVVLDESSCIKSFNSKTLGILLAAFGDTPFRLAATATPSPNDYTELGTHSEFLGVRSRTDMISEFFSHDGGDTGVFKLKGHARGEFWRWVASWAALLRRPSDLGYSDAGYILPPLQVHEHTIASDKETLRNMGVLFAENAASLTERRNARKASVGARIEACISKIKECTCGSQSTPHAASNEAQTTPSSEQSGTSKPAPAPLSKTEPTTSPTRKSTYERPSSEVDTTPSEGTSTRPTKRSARNAKTKYPGGTDSIPRSDSPSESRSTGSPSSSTTPCALPSAASAPSAGLPTQKENLESDSTSTTATRQDGSEVSSAQSAIAESGTFKTTPNSSTEPLRTCACDAGERWIVWCDLNAEQDALEKAFGDECISVFGALDADEKERRLMSFINGNGRILLGKPSIFGFGLNLQFVSRMAFVGVNDSFESYYQAVRRCYRFGQKREVVVHIFASDAEGAVVANLKRKEADSIRMAEELSAETRDAVLGEVRGTASNEKDSYNPNAAMTIPAWLRTEVA